MILFQLFFKPVQTCSIRHVLEQGAAGDGASSCSEHRQPLLGPWRRLEKGPDLGLLNPKVYNSIAWAKR